MVKTEVASSPEAEYDPADVKAAVKEEGAGDASVKLETTRSESHSVKTEAEEEEEEENEDEEEAEAEVDQEEEEEEEGGVAEELGATDEAPEATQPVEPAETKQDARRRPKEEEEETEVAAAPAEVVDEDAYIVRPRRCRRLQKGNSVLINDTSAIGNFYPGFFQDSFGILSGFFRNSLRVVGSLKNRSSNSS